jgi:hypothetical protein
VITGGAFWNSLTTGFPPIAGTGISLGLRGTVYDIVFGDRSHLAAGNPYAIPLVQLADRSQGLVFHG